MGKPSHLSHSIPYYSKPFNFLILQTIPFHFFSTTFFNFPNPYTISLNLNYLYHLEIRKINPMFEKIIPPIPFHFILFQTIQFFNFINHSILFYFFSTIFFNFPNSYTIFLNLNHLHHLKIHKVKPFNIFFFSNHSKLFSNYFSHPKE